MLIIVGRKLLCIKCENFLLFKVKWFKFLFNWYNENEINYFIYIIILGLFYCYFIVLERYEGFI